MQFISDDVLLSIDIRFLFRRDCFMNYLSKPLSDYTLEQLKNILAQYNDAMAKREEASKHDKFTKGVGNKKAMPFPPPSIDEYKEVTQEWVDVAISTMKLQSKRNRIIMSIANLNLTKDKDLIDQIGSILGIYKNVGMSR